MFWANIWLVWACAQKIPASLATNILHAVWNWMEQSFVEKKKFPPQSDVFKRRHFSIELHIQYNFILRSSFDRHSILVLPRSYWFFNKLSEMNYISWVNTHTHARKKSPIIVRAICYLNEFQNVLMAIAMFLWIDIKFVVKRLGQIYFWL